MATILQQKATIRENVLDTQGDLTTQAFADALDHNVNMVSQCLRGVMPPPIELAVKLVFYSGESLRTFYMGKILKDGQDLVAVDV